MSTEAMRDGSVVVMPEEDEHEDESFHRFFDSWIMEQHHHLQELISASNQQQDTSSILGPLVDRVVHHYEHYYNYKSRCAKNNVLSMFNPPWRSSLEDAFLWIGGWRPSMAFHLLYSKSSLQLEARLDELMHGLNTGDLGDLSSNQLEKVDKLQIQTLRKEREITEKMAKQQETVADSSMVELAHAVTLNQLMTTTRDNHDHDEDEDEARVDAALVPKKEGLVEILQRADDLRLETLKKVIDILTPMQAAHFLIAAAALHLRVHEWGKKRNTHHRH